MSELTSVGIDPVAIYADMSLLPPNPGQTVLWLENNRLSVRRPDKLPFAVELTPVTEALIVAGVIPRSLGRRNPDRALGKRHSVCHSRRLDHGAGRNRRAGRAIRVHQDSIAAGRAAALVGAQSD